MLPELEDSMKKDLELPPVLCCPKTQRTTAAGEQGCGELRSPTTRTVMWLPGAKIKDTNFGALRVDTLISKILLSKLTFILKFEALGRKCLR